ncbi:chromodomain-helicase-DNA-binding protein 1, putative [Plasmodium chabaudi chabaudi]|uniref:Chromodomain-helicase-DNA-binding protein 1, putative n=2 Tax=Plasmodium chabaudi TaxID=5825 RepID=A0A1D3LCE0_PLACU|nr:chromodomain-helicase-DNA-binding protein 1, putative [Plasmodium chabaudi chabaudi]
MTMMNNNNIVNNDNGTISITSSLLSNNDKNINIKSKLGINKNGNVGGGLHESYQKSMLSSYNMNNVPMPSMNYHGSNNVMNRYNPMNYPLQEMNPNMQMNNNMKQNSMQGNDMLIKQNSKDQNYMYYQRNNSNNFNNMHGNFYPYMNNGFYGMSSANCYKPNSTNVANNNNTNNFNQMNGSFPYDNTIRSGVGSSTAPGGANNTISSNSNNNNPNFVKTLNSVNYGDNINCNSMNNILNKDSENLDKSSQMKSLSNNMNVNNLNMGHHANNTATTSGTNNNSNNIPPYRLNSDSQLDKQNSIDDMNNNTRYHPMNMYNRMEYGYDNFKDENGLDKDKANIDKSSNSNNSNLLGDNKTNSSISNIRKGNNKDGTIADNNSNNDSDSYKKYKNEADANHNKMKDGKDSKLNDSANSNANNSYAMFPNYNLKYPMNMNMFNNMNNFNMNNKTGINNMGGVSNMNVEGGNYQNYNLMNNMSKMPNVNNYNMMNMYGDNRYNNNTSMNAGVNNNMINMNNYNNMNYMNNRNYANDMNMRLLNGRNIPNNMNNGDLSTNYMTDAMGNRIVNHDLNNMNDGSLNNGNKYVRKTAIGKQYVTNTVASSSMKKKIEAQKDKKKKRKKKNENSLAESDDEDDNDLYINSYVKKSAPKSSSSKSWLQYDSVEDKYTEKMKRHEKNDIFISPNIGAVGGRTNLRERKRVYNYAQIDNYYETDEEDKKVDEEKNLLKQEKQSMGGIDRVIHHRRIKDWDIINSIKNNPFLFINRKKPEVSENGDDKKNETLVGSTEASSDSLNTTEAGGTEGAPDVSCHKILGGVENIEDPALDDFYEEEDIVDINEVEFLVKWIGKSHIHNFFCTYEYLRYFNGVKKVDNYIKKIRLSFQKRKYMTADEIEQEKIYSEIKKQIEMDSIHAERIVTHRKCEITNEQLFLVKWTSCAYDQCTEETRQTLLDHNFGKLIEEYFDRESKIYGAKALSSIWNRGPLTATKFDPYNETPSYLQGKKLRAYQLTGLNWMVSRMKRNLSVLLADEMGLGKTVQTIAVVGHMLYKEKLIGPYLVLVPQSTVDNWLNEFKNWLPQANVVCYHGNAVSRELIRTYELKKVYVPNRGYRYKFDVCITTPSILNSVSDVELLKRIPWQLMVVDEAHQLKNRQSKRFIELKQFMAESKLLLSGTPLHNNLEELWTLLHFLNPQQYTYYEAFQKKYNEIENTSLIGEAKQKQLMQLQHELHEVILRRVKKDVEKSLPNKVERILRVELSPIQIEYYKNILTKNYEQLAKASGGAKNSLQNICMELKKVCNHPFLCCEPIDKDEYRERLVYSSGKICLLEKLLIRLKERGNRVLIFSQMVKMLNILSEYLTLRGFKHQRLDGTMTKEMRKKAMNHFNSKNSDDFVFLLSTKAGGLGINLTSADTVIIYDSDWNPQNDLQAGARAHRIGQTKTVQIYRLVTKDSIEQTILERAKVKMVLDTLVVQGLNKKQNDNVNFIGGEGSNSSNGFTREELSKILKFGSQKLWEKNSSKYSPQDGEDGKNIIKGVDVDLDKILEEAEANENTNNANKDINSELNSLQNGAGSSFFNSNSNLFGGAAGVAGVNNIGGGGIADDLLSSYNNITEFKYEPPENLKSNILYNDSTKQGEIDIEENDKDFWDKTIPLEERLKLKKMKEEELLVHGPRKTRTRDARYNQGLYYDGGANNNNSDGDDSDEFTIKYTDKYNKNLNKKKRKRRTSTQITEKDKFRLYRSILKFGNPTLRIDDIQFDSKLMKVDRNVILTELNIIVDTCKEIVERVSKDGNNNGQGALANPNVKMDNDEQNEYNEDGEPSVNVKNNDMGIEVKGEKDQQSEEANDENDKSTRGKRSTRATTVSSTGENGEAADDSKKEENNTGGGFFSKFMKFTKGSTEPKREDEIEGKGIKTKTEDDTVKDELDDDMIKDELNDESDNNNKTKGERGRKIDAYTFYIGTNKANALDLCHRLQLFKSLHDFIKEQNNDNEYSFRLPLIPLNGANGDVGVVETAGGNSKSSAKSDKTKGKKDDPEAAATTANTEGEEGKASNGYEGAESSMLAGGNPSDDYLKLKLPNYIFDHLRDLSTKDVKAWTKENDENLIKGVYIYGFGSFNEICADVNLNLEHMKNIKWDKIKMRCIKILKMIEEYTSSNKEGTTGKKRRRARGKNKNNDEIKDEYGNNTSIKSEENGGTSKGNNASGRHGNSNYGRRSSERVKAIYSQEDKETGGVLKKRAVSSRKGERDNKNGSSKLENVYDINSKGDNTLLSSSTADKRRRRGVSSKSSNVTLKNEKTNSKCIIESSECSSSNEQKSNGSDEDDDDESNVNIVKRSGRSGSNRSSSRMNSYENYKLTRRRSTRTRRGGNDSIVGSECINSIDPDGDDEYYNDPNDRKKLKKKKKKKDKKKKLTDEEIIEIIKNTNLREMDQHSINKLTKKPLKKYKKLLKIVKKVLSSIELGEVEEDESEEIRKKTDELIFYIGNYIGEFFDHCADSECKDILNNSGWEYISNFMNETSDDLRSKYEQLKSSNLKDSNNADITEENIISFFYSKKGSGSLYPEDDPDDGMDE